MDFEKKEKIIRGIVEKVLTILIESDKLINPVIKSENTGENCWRTDKTLLTAEDIYPLKNKGFRKIAVSSETIITPLAIDVLKEMNLSISRIDNKKVIHNEVRNSGECEKIAVLSNHYDEAYKVKIKQYLQKLGIDVECLLPENFTLSELESAINGLVRNIAQGNYSLGIVISNDSYQIRKKLKNTSNLETNICWEIENNNSCFLNSKILFVNSSLIGFKKLEEKIEAWISHRQK